MNAEWVALLWFRGIVSSCVIILTFHVRIAHTLFSSSLRSSARCRKWNKRYERACAKNKIPFTESPWKRYAESNGLQAIVFKMRYSCAIHKRVCMCTRRRGSDSECKSVCVSANIHRFDSVITYLVHGAEITFELQTMQISSTTKGHRANFGFFFHFDGVAVSYIHISVPRVVNIRFAIQSAASHRTAIVLRRFNAIYFGERNAHWFFIDWKR